MWRENDEYTLLEMLNLINFRSYYMIGGCPDHEEIEGTEMDNGTIVSKPDNLTCGKK